MTEPHIEPAFRALEFDRLLSALASHAGSDEGREKLLSLRPTRDLKWVREELERVEELRAFFARGGSMGGGGAEIRLILQRAAISGSILTVEDLLAVLTHLRVYRTVRRTLDRERYKMPLLHHLAVPLTALPELESQLDRVLSPEGTVRDSASPELSRLRRTLASQMELIRQKIAALIPRMAKLGALREDTFTMREGRYVLPVRSDALGKVKGIIHDRSATGITLFVEPTAIIDAGNELRTLELAERDELLRILKELTGKVRDHLDQIDANRRIMTALDCLAAKAQFAERMDAIVPTLSSTGAIRILGGRHPLLVLIEDKQVVPLNLELGVDYTTLVISGPNAGGKSVALKCVGLLCLMAGCGLPVPANPGTELPLLDEVLAYIGDQQSLADDLSTFTAHAAGLKQILDSADSRTLVLIDEIGAGTDPQEGSSLSIAVLERLTARKAPAIVTTHHSALKAFAHSTPGCANGSMEFDLKSFTPTYRFLPDLPGSSYALDIARRAGLDEQLIHRAREILGAESSHVEELIASLTDKVRRYEMLLVGAEKLVEQRRAEDEAYQRRLDKLEKREKEAKQKALHEAEEIVKQARKAVEAAVKEIRERAADRDSIRTAHQELARIGGEIASQLNRPPPKVEIPQPPSREPEPQRLLDKQPEVGDSVAVDGSATVGEVTAVSSKGDRVCVAVGAVQLWISRQRVTVVEPPEPVASTRSFVKLPDVPFELDVRGLDAEEAVRRVDRYLSDGSAAGRERLGIIHGKGLGILSHHIRNLLKDHPLVADFRFGEFGAGDYGVTVVDLKK